jgi:serine phosphatase RsbU (regulator of sigma subunit)
MPRGLRADYPLRNAKLPPHCEILLYTDGVTECSGDEGRFGRERMLGILATCRGGGATLLERILASFDAFTTGHPVCDDVTLAAVTVGVPGLG